MGITQNCGWRDCSYVNGAAAVIATINERNADGVIDISRGGGLLSAVQPQNSRRRNEIDSE